MQVRRLLAPAVWVTATVSAAALVSGAVRLAVRSVAPPAAAARLPTVHHTPTVPTGPTATADSTSRGSEMATGPRLPVTGPDDGTTTVPSAASPPATVRRASGAKPDGDPMPASPGPTDPTGPTGPTGSTGPSTSSSPHPTRSPTPSSSTTTTSTTVRSSPSSSTTTTSSSTTSTTRPTDVYSSAGGSIGIRCSGDTVSLVFASPNNGFQTRVLDSGPDAVDVRFIGDRHVSEIRVTCSGGEPTDQVSERRD